MPDKEALRFAPHQITAGVTRSSEIHPVCPGQGSSSARFLGEHLAAALIHALDPVLPRFQGGGELAAGCAASLLLQRCARCFSAGKSEQEPGSAGKLLALDESLTPLGASLLPLHLPHALRVSTSPPEPHSANQQRLPRGCKSLRLSPRH